jgi:hypothetical protein
MLPLAASTTHNTPERNTLKSRKEFFQSMLNKMANAEKLSNQVISKAFQPMILVLNIGIGGGS